MQMIYGRSQDLTRKMVSEMKSLAAQLKFEEAQTIKERYETIMEFKTGLFIEEILK